MAQHPPACGPHSTSFLGRTHPSSRVSVCPARSARGARPGRGPCVVVGESHGGAQWSIPRTEGGGADSLLRHNQRPRSRLDSEAPWASASFSALISPPLCGSWIISKTLCLLPTISQFYNSKAIRIFKQLTVLSETPRMQQTLWKNQQLTDTCI